MPETFFYICRSWAFRPNVAVVRFRSTVVLVMDSGGGIGGIIEYAFITVGVLAF